jgi:glycerol-3-phosphate dehydrogenase
VGAGIVRDAAMRGLKVGLVEQGDFASGTSSRSSRMLHGGIRYLAQGNIRLVRQASLEKRIVSEIAPHISAPLPFIFPTYRNTPWPKWKLSVGVKLYDFLCSGKNLGKSGSFSREKTKNLLHGINDKKLTGSVRYFDGATSDARLVTDTLRSAIQHDAQLLNYAKLIEVNRQDECWQGSIQNLPDSRIFNIKAKCLVNATGPWSDQFKQSQMLLRKTKGVHVVVDRKRLPVPEAVMMTEGPRVVYAIGWGERVYIGTTDTDFDAAPESVQTDQADIDYILGVTNQFFPDAKLDSNDVIKTWAGVRPLVYDKRGQPSDVSRSHLITMRKDGWIDVGGGKLTTYRLMAQEVVEKITKLLNYTGKECRTAIEPLLAENEIARGFSRIVPPEVTFEAVEHYCLNEWALHLDDVMIRRTRWHYYLEEPAHTAAQVASWMASLLGWDEQVKQEELNRYRGLSD